MTSYVTFKDSSIPAQQGRGTHQQIETQSLLQGKSLSYASCLPVFNKEGFWGSVGNGQEG